MEKDPRVKIEVTDSQDLDGEEIAPSAIRGVTVQIGGRDIPLVYNMRVQLAAEHELELDFTDLQEALTKKKCSSRTVISALRLMGNEGLRKAGQNADLTEDWLTDHIVPIYMASYRVATLGALTRGWFMENEQETDNDPILAEVRKKNESTT